MLLMVYKIMIKLLFQISTADENGLLYCNFPKSYLGEHESANEPKPFKIKVLDKDYYEIEIPLIY